MNILNIEIKARCADPEGARRKLESLDARYVGRDRQVDTYFNVAEGRLKLREGNIENSLISYSRPDQEGPKASNVVLYHVSENSAALKAALTQSIGVWITVDKQRDIYFIDNVKCHVDEVAGLGSFVELEAIDQRGDKDIAALQKQCEDLMTILGIDTADLVAVSYSDLLEETKGNG